MQWLSEVGPLEGFGHRAIEVSDEVQHVAPEIVSGGEIASPQQLADQDTQPKLDLVQPGRVLRRVMEDDFVRWVGQKRGSRRYRFQNAALLLDAKVVGDTRDVGYVAHEGLGAVRVQVVRTTCLCSNALRPPVHQRGASIDSSFGAVGGGDCRWHQIAVD